MCLIGFIERLQDEILSFERAWHFTISNTMKEFKTNMFKLGH